MFTRLTVLLAASFTIFAANGVEKSHYQTATDVYKNSEVIKGVEILGYDCGIGTVESTKGFCVIVIKEKGKEASATYLASPEVAAPYSNGDTPAEARPQTDLEVRISPSGTGIPKEIIRIEAQGKTVSEKISFLK